MARTMRALLLFIAVTLGSAARTVEKAKGGPGTQTVLLIKGGVGFDVNLLSTSPQTVRRSKDAKAPNKDSAASNQWTLDLKDEQKIADDLTSSLQNTVDFSKKHEDQVRSLKKRVLKAQKLLSQKDDEFKKLQEKELAAEKALQVKNKMLLHERHEADLLKKKVQDLEQDIEVSNRAWKEAADHEKEVAAEATQAAREEAAKNDRLSQQMAVKPQKKISHVAPKAKPSHSKFMKTLKKQTVKLAKAASKTDAEVEDESMAPNSLENAESESTESDDMTEEETPAPVDESDVAMQDDIAPDDVADATQGLKQVPSEEEEMPVAEEQPVKQGKKAVVDPPMVHATNADGGAQVTDSLDAVPGPSEDFDASAPTDAEDSESADDKVVDSSTDADALKDSSASSEEDSSWDMAYTPAARAATVEESVEGNPDADSNSKDSEDVLSPDAPMPVEEDPNDNVPAEPDLMGKV